MPALLKNKLFWGLLCIVVVTALALFQRGMGLEWAGYGFGKSMAPKRAPNPQVVVVAIDAAAIKQFGAWPWPRSYIAKLVDVLADDKAGVVAFTEDVSAPQNAVALDYLNQLDTLATGDANVTPKLTEAQAALDTDGALMASMTRSGRVLLAARGTRISPNTTRQTSGGSPSFGLPLDLPAAPEVALDAPLPKLTNAARGVGYLDDETGDTALSPLLVQSSGHVVPTLALLVAAREQDIETSRIGVQSLGGITLGDTLIRTDRGTEVITEPSAAAIPRYGFIDVITGAVPAEKLAGKAVLVGRAETGQDAPVIGAAALVSGLLNGDLVSTPFWAWGLRALLSLTVGLYLLLLMPRLSDLIAIVVTAVLALGLLIGEYVPLLSQSLWLPLMLPLLLLILGHIVLSGLGFIRERSGVSRGAMSELNREYALTLQALSCAF